MEFGIGVIVVLTLYALRISGTVFHSSLFPLETDQAFSCLEVALSNTVNDDDGHYHRKLRMCSYLVLQYMC